MDQNHAMPDAGQQRTKEVQEQFDLQIRAIRYRTMPDTPHHRKSEMRKRLLDKTGDYVRRKVLIPGFANNTDDANEIAQMASMCIHKDLDNYDAQKATYNTWIWKRMTDARSDFYQKKKRYPTTTSVEVMIDTIDERPSPHEDIETKEKMLNVRNAVEKLPVKLRVVVIMYHYDNRSYDEIATDLSIPIGTVKSRLVNARRILRERLRGLLGE